MNNDAELDSVIAEFRKSGEEAEIIRLFPSPDKVGLSGRPLTPLVDLIDAKKWRSADDNKKLKLLAARKKELSSDWGNYHTAYSELREQGIDALSQYDVGFGGGPGEALKMALDLRQNHLSYANSRLGSIVKLVQQYRISLQQIPEDKYKNILFVGPDRVGDQSKTLEMQDKARHELARLNAAGGVLLMPIQKGDKSFGECWGEIRKTLNADADIDWTRIGAALPNNKDAATIDDVESLVAHQYSPMHVHLLGISTDTNQKTRLNNLVDAIKGGEENTVITTDASQVRGLFGQGRRGTTEIERIMREEIEAAEDWTEILETVADLASAEKLDTIGRHIGYQGNLSNAEDLHDAIAEADPEGMMFESAVRKVLLEDLVSTREQPLTNSELRTQAITNLAEKGQNGIDQAAEEARDERSGCR